MQADHLARAEQEVVILAKLLYDIKGMILMSITDFYMAWKFIDEKLNNLDLSNCLSIDVVKVNPATLEIDDDLSLNTQIRVWIELSLPSGSGYHVHPYELDTGGGTFEEAILNMANFWQNNPQILKNLKKNMEMNMTNKKIKSNYGEWAGNPKGIPYNPEKCAYEVWNNFCFSHQCSRKPGHGKDKLYCKQHAPKTWNKDS